MVSKCANPQCDRTFHYMHEGKLFQLRLEPVQGVMDSYEDQFNQGLAARTRLHFYWLCDECSWTYTLVVHGGNTITLEPLEDFEPLARAC